MSWLQHHSHQIYDLGLLVVLTLHQVNFEIIHYISQILNGFWWLNVKLSSNSKAFLTDLCWTCWISIAYSWNSVVCAGSTHVSCPGENSRCLSSPSTHLWLAVKKIIMLFPLAIIVCVLAILWFGTTDSFSLVVNMDTLQKIHPTHYTTACFSNNTHQ